MNIDWISKVNRHNQPRSPYISLDNACSGTDDQDIWLRCLKRSNDMIKDQLYVHWVQKQKKSCVCTCAQQNSCYIFYLINYCKPVTICINQILIFHPNKFMFIIKHSFWWWGGGRNAFHSTLCTVSYYTFFFTDPERSNEGWLYTCI